MGIKNFGATGFLNSTGDVGLDEFLKLAYGVLLSATKILRNYDQVPHHLDKISMDFERSFLNFDNNKVHENDLIEVGDIYIDSYGDEVNDVSLTREEFIELGMEWLKKEYAKFKPAFRCISSGNTSIRSLYVSNPSSGCSVQAMIESNGISYFFINPSAPIELYNQYRALRVKDNMQPGDIAAAKNILLDYLADKDFFYRRENEILKVKRIIRNEHNFVNL